MVSLNVSMLMAMIISELVFSNVCTDDTSWVSSNLVGFYRRKLFGSSLDALFLVLHWFISRPVVVTHICTVLNYRI